MSAGAGKKGGYENVGKLVNYMFRVNVVNWCDSVLPEPCCILIVPVTLCEELHILIPERFQLIFQCHDVLLSGASYCPLRSCGAVLS